MKEVASKVYIYTYLPNKS